MMFITILATSCTNSLGGKTGGHCVGTSMRGKVGLYGTARGNFGSSHGPLRKRVPNWRNVGERLKLESETENMCV